MSETTHIQNIQREDSVRLAYFKHRGNVSRIQQETKLPVEFIKSCVKRLRDQARKDSNALFSETICLNLFLGHEQRRAYLEAIMNELSGLTVQTLSLCCSAAPELLETGDDRKKQWYCTSCNGPCSISIVAAEEINKQQMRAIELLRKEDEALVKFLEGLNLLGTKPTPQITQQNVLIVGDQKIEPEPGSDIQTEIADMAPKDRLKLVRRLERHITTIDVEFEEGDGEGATKSS